MHIVVRGENLSAIAKKYSLSLGKLIYLNPFLKNNPNLIYPGMVLRISDIINISDARISRILFNGKTLTVYSMYSDRTVAAYPAVSGLPPNAPHLAELIKKGREDLDIEIDYTLSKHQNVKDAGPIPEDNYALPLRPGMPYDKSKAAGDGAGWGEGGWMLVEHLWAKLGNIFGGRFGFFLHHDGGAVGTSGCIGLKQSEDIVKLKIILIKAQSKGQNIVPVKVKYND